MSGDAAQATGTLYGVGVGPGDPDLVTLAAARVLGATGTIAFFAKAGRKGHARTIAEPHLRPDRQELRLDYPFTVEVEVSDPQYFTRMDAFYDDSAAAIAAVLDQGADVAVLCEGDPFFYGSYMYIHDRLARRYPTRVIPGITGMSACWTVADAPITEREDTLTVLSGTLDEDGLTDRLRRTDAAVVMKVGRHFAKIRRAMAAAGHLDHAIYVERGSMAGQVVRPLVDCPEDMAAPYFSIVLAPGRRGARS